MSLFGRISNIFEKRQAILDPRHWLTKIVSANGASSGASVTSDTALKVSAVYACVKVIAETLASLPLMLYRHVGDGKEAATDHPAYSLLHDAPNDYQTAFEFRECQTAHLNLRGNSFAQKVQAGSGKTLSLIPLNPGNMTVERVNGRVTYKYRHLDGKEEDFPAEKIWHVKNMPISCSFNADSPEGLVGVSPITAARESIGLALTADEYGGKYFANNASVGMGLKFPAGVRLSDNAKKFLKDSLSEYGKMENKFKSIILEDGGDLVKIGMSNEDSQFLQSRQFSIEEIARIFRVPPVLIGHPTNTMTYASAEQLFLAFATYTIRPWCVRLEQSMNRFLLTEKERKAGYFFEHVIAGLLRGDTASRYAAYAQARQWGWMSVDEIRSLENMNPLPDGRGSYYLQPLNMTEPGKEPPAPSIPPPKDQGGNQNAA